MIEINILIVSDTIFSFISGAANFTNRLIDGLSKNHNITIITSTPYTNNVISNYGKSSVYRFKGVRMPMTDKEAFFAIPKKKYILDIIKKHKINLIITFIPTYLTLLTVRCANKLNIPIISTCHTQPENVLGNIGINNKLMNHLFQKYNVWIHNKTDIVICPSVFAYNMLVRYGLKIRAEIISNGVPTDIFKPMNCDKIIKKHNLRNKKVILFVGRLMEEKDIFTLLSAFMIVKEEISSTKLIIIGKGYMEEKLKEFANKWNLDVIFTGRVSNEDLPLYYNACDVFVLPSLVELQGIVVLEAMATKKPVIVSDSRFSASSELVQKNMVFEAGNHYDLARKIIKSLNDKKLRKKIGNENYNNIKKYHSMDKIINKWEEMISKC